MPITLDPKAPEHASGTDAGTVKAGTAESPAPAVARKRRTGRTDRFDKDPGPAPSHDPELGTKKPPRGRASGLKQIDSARVQANAGGVRAPVKTAPPVPPRPDAATRAATGAGAHVDGKAPPPLPPRPGQVADARTPPPLPPRPGQAAAVATPSRSNTQKLFGKVLDSAASDYLSHGVDGLLQDVRTRAPSVGVERRHEGALLHPVHESTQHLGGLATHRNVTELEVDRYRVGGNARVGLGGAELGHDVVAGFGKMASTSGSVQRGDHALTYGLRGGMQGDVHHASQASAGVDGVKLAVSEGMTQGPSLRGETGLAGRHGSVRAGAEVYDRAHVEQSHAVQAGPLGAQASLGGSAGEAIGATQDLSLASAAGVAHGRIKAEALGSLTDRGEASVGLGGVHALHDIRGEASAGVTGGGDFTSRGVRIGGEQLDLRGQGQVSAKLLAEGAVHAQTSATIKPPRACVDVEGKAFAGLKAEATGQVGLGEFVTVHGNADVRAGIGAQGVCRVGLDQGKLRIKLGAGWGSGVGAGAGVGIDVDVVKIGTAGARLGLQAASAPVRYVLDPKAMLRDRQQLVQSLRTVSGFPQGIAKMSTGIATGVVKKALGGIHSDDPRAAAGARPQATHTQASHTAQGILSKNLSRRRPLPLVSQRQVEEAHAVGKAQGPTPASVRKAIELLKD